MNFSAWNVRGLWGDGKLRMVKDLKKKYSLNMLGLIETKRQVVTNFDVARIWGRDDLGWEYVSSDGASGGLLLIWDESVFKMNEKCHVWEELSYIAGLCQVPCCFMGDFNEIVHVEERKGATTVPRSGKEFRNWIQDMQLVDLALTDCDFTWFRGRSCSHIDRALVNVEWLEVFPETWLRGGQGNCQIIAP
ncbi:uncharacterized protein [Arachis hypogaea]|uniref:uncharacterized protein n=1 Tax=Arachis hypogaea TaxID=3818 RepID=UPI003B223018